jgi:hypothetical protein
LADAAFGETFAAVVFGVDIRVGANPTKKYLQEFKIFISFLPQV